MPFAFFRMDSNGMSTPLTIFAFDDERIEKELLRLQQLTARRADQISLQQAGLRDDVQIWTQAEEEIFGLSPDP